MARKSRKASKKTTIIMIALIVILLIVAVSGTVAFLKNRGEAAAADLEEQNNEQISTGEQNANNEQQENVPEGNGEQTNPNEQQQGNDAQNNNPNGVQGNVGQNDNQNGAQGNVGNGQQGNAGTAVDNIQETTITRVETVEIPEQQISEGHYVGWTTMSINADLASAKIGARYVDITSTKTNSIEPNEEGKKIVKVGDTFNYTITLRNSGNTKGSVRVIDDVPDTLEIEKVSIENAKIEGNRVDFGNVEVIPGTPVELTISVKVKENVEGTIHNIATVENDKVEDKDKIDTINVEVKKEVKEIKRNGEVVTEPVKVNDVISYNVIVTNKGSLDKEVNVSDILKDKILELKDENNKVVTKVTVEAGKEKVLTATYTVKQSDIDEQKAIENVAKIEYDEEEKTSEVETPVEEAKPDYKATKTANVEKVKAVGDVIEYTITVENTGNVTLENIVVEDSMINLKKTIERIEVGATVEVKGTYIVKQSDIDNGKITNVAVVDGEEVTEIVEVEQNPAYEATKIANKKTVKAAGEEIEYTITVKNTGNTTLENVVVVDKMININKTIEKIEVGETATVKGTYIVKQSDIDNGKITNVAIVNGEEVTEIVEVEQNPAYEATKVANKQTVKEAGEVIEYTITVKNTGNTTLKNISVEDKMIKVSTTIATIEVGKSVEIKGTYTVKQTDIDNGKITNIATVNGEEVTEIVEVEQNPAYEAEKIANKDKVSKVGEEIVYTITVKNTGNTTLKDIEVVDTMINVNRKIATIEVGDTATITGTYIVKQSDIDNGKITNVATVNGEEVTEIVEVEQNPAYETSKVADKKTVKEVGEVINYTITVKNTGNTTLKDIEIVDTMINVNRKIATIEVGDTAIITGTYTVKQSDIDNGKITNIATVNGEEVTEIVEVEQNPGYKAEKTANKQTVKEVGEVIEFTITVTNTGNTTLKDIKVVDKMINVNTIIEKIEVGETATIKGTYTVKQSDIDNGKITNVATVNDEEVTKTVTVEQNPAYEAEKIADKKTVKEAGEVIEYTIIVKNTGNTTLENISVIDDMIEINEIIATIEVGETATVKGTYTVKQSDIDNGAEIKNIATVGSKTVTEIVEVDQNPGYEATKTADVETVKAVGDVINYTITVKNTGNTTLKNVSVVDEMVNLSTTIATIDVGKSVSITRAYTVTQEDIDAGTIRNVAKVNGEETEKTIPVETNPSIDVQKDVTGLTVGNTEYTFENISVNGIKAQQGNTITYSIVVTNTGNTTLANVKITDNKNVKLENVELPQRLVDENIQIATGNVITNGNNLLGRNDITLKPEETITLTVSYTLTRNDVTGTNFEKDFVNVANAEGTYKTTKYDDNDDATIGTEYPIATGDVTVEKYWADENYTVNRPASITVQLKNGETNVGEPVVINGSKDNATWTYTWHNLDLEDANGNKINYTVYETPVTGYTTAVTPIDNKNVIKVTNTYNFIPQEITVIKNYTETTTEKKAKPVDVVFVLDTSGSMVNKGTTRAQDMVDATNTAIATILSNPENRVGIVGFSSDYGENEDTYGDANTLLKLGYYTPNSNGKYLVKDDDKIKTTVTNKNVKQGTRYLEGGTYTQAGIAKAASLFTATDEKRTPVVILLTDGEPSVATTAYNNVRSSNIGDGTDSEDYRYGYYTVLSANYYKNQINNKYTNGTAYMYTVGFGISSSNLTYAKAVLDPSTTNINACNNKKNSEYVRELYNHLTSNSNPYKGNCDYADGSFVGESLDLDSVLNQVIDETTEKDEREKYTYTVRTEEGLKVIKSGKLDLTELDETGTFTIKVNNEVKATSLQDAITKGYVKGTTGNYYLDLSKVNISSATVVVEYDKK